MKSRITTAFLAASALAGAACADTGTEGPDVAAEANVPEPSFAQLVPGYEMDFGDDPQDGRIIFRLQGRVVFETDATCETNEEGARNCNWEGPTVVAATDGIVAYSNPGVNTVALLRDGKLVTEVPVGFEVSSVRFDGTHVWVMPVDYLSKRRPPVLLTLDGEIAETPKYWEAR